MKISSFMQFARRELRAIPHPYRSDSLMQIQDIDQRIYVLDEVLSRASGRYEALSENFYQAVSAYLFAPRHQKVVLRGAIERLAIHFEAFLRTAVATVVPDRDGEMRDEEGRSRGRLSDQGYVPDILRALCDLRVKLRRGDDEYWQRCSAEEALYGITFRHQQRGKHESRDYSLRDLESLALHVLGAYLVFVGWLMSNSQITADLREQQTAAAAVLALNWPAVLAFQLSELRIGSDDPDLQEVRERLLDQVQDLQSTADELRRRGGAEDASPIDELFTSVQVAADEYEQLVTESNMREWGRESMYSEYT